MHKTAIVLTLALAAVAVTLALVPAGGASAEGPDYLDVASFTASGHGRQLARLSVTTGAAIPKRPDAFVRSHPVVGLAWVDAATLTAFVVTIHPVLGRDSHQRPDGWHAHTVALTAGATAPNDFCLGGITGTPTAGITLHGATLRVNVRGSKLPIAAGAVDLATGFTVESDTACASRLGVRTTT